MRTPQSDGLRVLAFSLLIMENTVACLPNPRESRDGVSGQLNCTILREILCACAVVMANDVTAHSRLEST
jgi:hypothetical protein